MFKILVSSKDKFVCVLFLVGIVVWGRELFKWVFCLVIEEGVNLFVFESLGKYRKREREFFFFYEYSFLVIKMV